MQNDPNQPIQIANSSDFDAVAIYFDDDTITHVFSELLQALGVKTKIVNDSTDLVFADAVITEPNFLDLLNQKQREHCLVVGNKDSLHSSSVLSLSRPLTEEKVLAALNQFLDRLA